MTATTFVNTLATNILNPLLYLLFSATLIVFLYGIVEFLWGYGKQSGTGDSKGFNARNLGKKHMLYGLIGLFIMLTASSIIGFVVNTLFSGSWPPHA